MQVTFTEKFTQGTSSKQLTIFSLNEEEIAEDVMSDTILLANGLAS